MGYVRQLSGANPVVAVTGLAFEARIAAGPGVFVVCSGNGSRLQESLQDAVKAGCRGLISFGIAGGLCPTLKPGSWVVASAVIDESIRHKTSALWSDMIMKTHPDAVYAPIVGVPAPVARPEAKRALQAETGAVAVDMESHMVARVAAAHALPFAAFRVVADPSHRSVPEAAIGVTLADGTADILAVLRSLARRPRQLPHLIGTALDTRRARAAMVESRRVLGTGFGFPVAVAAMPERSA